MLILTLTFLAFRSIPRLQPNVEWTMFLTDTAQQRAAFAKQFPNAPDLSKDNIAWKFSKCFAFPHTERPLIADLCGKTHAARKFLNEETEKAALSALVKKLQPTLVAKVTM